MSIVERATPIGVALLGTFVTIMIARANHKAGVETTQPPSIMGPHGVPIANPYHGMVQRAIFGKTVQK